jgi:mannose-6-phosphate isomerase-like protein (cupin superfamily)
MTPQKGQKLLTREAVYSPVMHQRSLPMPAPASRLGQHRYGPGGGRYRIIATADSTRNSFFALEILEPPGAGTPLHRHSREDEFFHVLEGELTVFVDGKTVILTAGQSLFAPRDIPHCFKNCTSRPVKYLCFCTPPDIEPFFDYGLPLPSGGAPSDEQMIQKAVALAPQFGIEMLGPSPL